MVWTGPDLARRIDPAELLALGIAARPDETALASSDAAWTWRELDELAGRWAAHLLGCGLRPGDRVASLMPNRPALLAHYLGCWKAGLVATPLNYRYTPREIDHALSVSEARLILCHEERRSDVEASEAGRRLPLGRVDFTDTPPGGLATLARDASPTATFPAPEPSAPAIIFFTSGSTGKPKGVTHSRETLGAMIASAAYAFELSDRDTLLPGSSMSHLGAFLFAFGALSVAAKVVASHSFDGDELLPLMRKHRPTVLTMIPAALLALVRDHGATRDDFSSLRLCRSGADKVSAELEREFADLAGFPIDEGYGMTEIGIATLNPPSGRIAIGSIGTANPGFELSIRDEAGSELPPDAVGRLWVRSPTNMLGYWDNPDATAETIVDGWLDSGDLMRADADGYFWFFGRKKQIIVHDGSNISPQEVEQVLAEHPSVELAGVIGIHDLVHGENVRAFVSIRDGAQRPTSQELIRFARERVGYKAPEEVVFLDEIPLNPTGKVDRPALKRMTERGHNPHHVEGAAASG